MLFHVEVECDIIFLVDWEISLLAYFEFKRLFIHSYFCLESIVSFDYPYIHSILEEILFIVKLDKLFLLLKSNGY